jgi:hypothetical protein
MTRRGQGQVPAAGASAQPPATRKIVVCLDGTNDELGVSRPTNPAKVSSGSGPAYIGPSAARARSGDLPNLTDANKRRAGHIPIGRNPRLKGDDAAMSLASSIASTPLAESTSDVLGASASVVWPAIVILAIVVFHKPLRAAIGRISEVDIGSTKVVLQKQAEHAANTTKSLIGTGDDAPASPRIIAEAKGKAASDPSNSVLYAWTGVENATRKAAQEAPGVASPSVPEVVNRMTAQGELNPALVPVAKTLESLRAEAATKPKTITPAIATSFVTAADDLARLITRVTSQPAKTGNGSGGSREIPMPAGNVEHPGDDRSAFGDGP